MKRKLICLFAILMFFSFVSGSEEITNFSITTDVRLGEKVAVTGQYNNDTNGSDFVLCKVVVFDSNNEPVERWTDEYTFTDGSIYAEKTVNEPPSGLYFRGDDYNLVVTCGQSVQDGLFTIDQPVSVAHSIEKGWEFIFEENNIDAGLILFSFIMLFLILILLIAFIIKKGGNLAS